MLPRIALQIDQDIDVIGMDAPDRIERRHTREIDESVAIFHDAPAVFAAIIRATGMGVHGNGRPVMRPEQTQHQMGRRVIMKIARQVTAHKLQVSGVTLGLTVGKELRAAVDADTIEHRGKPAFVTPLRFTDSLTGSGPKITFGGRVFDAAERISITLNGRHDRETKRGALTVDTQKLVFLPTALQPVQLFPILGTAMREVDGEVDMLAIFAWDDGAVTWDMELLVDAKLIKADEFSFENAAEVVRFDSFLPPSTPPEQEVNIGLLDVGVRMLNGRLEFQLNNDGSVLAALRELDFFGGRIKTDQFTIPENYDGFTVPLQVNGD